MSTHLDKLSLDRYAMKDRNTAYLRIYVGGIPEATTLDDLYEHFIQFGHVTGVVVNKNFGFVQFENEQSAQNAIKNADGSVLLGKSINVRTALMTDKRRETEVVHIKPDIPPAVALTADGVAVEDSDEMYDSFGNYIGDQGYDEEEVSKEEVSSVNLKEEVAKVLSYSKEEVSSLRLEDDCKKIKRVRTRPRVRTRKRKAGGYGEEDDEYPEESYVGVRGRGRGRGLPRGRARGRGAYDHAIPPAARGPVPPGRYERYPPPIADYPPPPPRALPVPERNDCEIIVVAKSLTEYAEYVESRLKRLGIVVDLLFPMEDVPIGKVLGNIASRGCLYAILVMPQNQEKRSLTLTILHGLPQEHRNMPIEDALQLMSRNFQEVQRGGPGGREAVYALLGQLADGRALTVLQYDKVLEYLQDRREQQVKLELGEPLKSAPVNKTQVDLQQRILSILNDKKPEPPAPAPAPANSKLLNDPTVRKALDSILSKFT